MPRLSKKQLARVVKLMNNKYGGDIWGDFFSGVRQGTDIGSKVAKTVAPFLPLFGLGIDDMKLMSPAEEKRYIKMMTTKYGNGIFDDILGSITNIGNAVMPFAGMFGKGMTKKKKKCPHCGK